MRTNTFICIFLLIITSISGCYEPSHISLKSLVRKNLKFKPLEIIQEYVSRVGKRLLIVKARSNNLFPQINFTIIPNVLPQIKIKLNSSTNIANIIISKGLIDYLENEAELAAIIAIKIEQLEFNDFCSDNLADNTQADLRIIQHLARASYDPSFFGLLEQEYLNNPSKKDWLNAVFSCGKIIPARISITAANLSKVPAGLQHNKENFLNNVYLF